MLHGKVHAKDVTLHHIKAAHLAAALSVKSILPRPPGAPVTYGRSAGKRAASAAKSGSASA